MVSLDRSTLANRSAFFRANGEAASEILEPLPNSASGWAGDQIRGMAVSGALARATERAAALVMPEMRPARWHVDLFRPARVRPTTVATTVARQGRRVGIIDAELWQDDRPVARSRTLFTRPGSTPDGQVWRPDVVLPAAPPPTLSPVGDDPRLYYSEQVGWSTDTAVHHNASRKCIWHLPVILVEDEQATPFEMVATVSDMASLAANWGSAGVQFINADIDLVLTRLPLSMEVGLVAMDRIEQDGVAVGTAIVFDRAGQLGSATVVAVANPNRSIDPGDRRPDLSAFSG